MLRLYLVRHGETDWNAEGRMQGHSDIALNANGLAQARRLAGRLTEEGDFSALYSSPLLRASRTAEMIGERLGLSVTLDARLIEHHIGQLEGLTLGDIKEKFPDIYKAWRGGGARQPLPGEEARADFQARLREFVEDVRTRHAEDQVIAVTHGGAMSMCLATLLNLDIERRFPFWIDNASLSIVEVGAHTTRVRLLNDTCHLREHRRMDEAEKFEQDELSTSAESRAPSQSVMV